VRVSVIIPARDAEATIGRAVRAAVAQELDGEFEVVVVDDGSRDDTARVAADAGARVVSNAAALGPADARNAGVAQAKAPLIAFTDADCVAAPGWLAAGVRALERADLVQGHVEPEPGVSVGPFDHTIAVREETGLYETANVFVKREWFDRVGGFRPFLDPAQGHFGEDLVFGWELRRAGGRTVYADDALVHHDVVRRDRAAFLAERRRLRLFPEVTRAVPELRASRWYLRLFLSPRTAKFDLAIVAVLAAIVTRRPLLVLLAIPYARTTFWSHRWWQRAVARQNLTQVAGDLIGLAALIEGSAKTGRVVL
jgi:glycosyltransferase involved in cell wall biosynthesis